MNKKAAIILLVLIYSFLNVEAQFWTQMGENINGDLWNAELGSSVSLSSDGLILAIGAPKYDENKGYVMIYQYNSGIWSQIGNIINGEAYNDYFGSSVSLSSDGNIIAIGAPNSYNNGIGYVKLYQNNNGNWTQIGNKIEGEGINEYFGVSVSLSFDGIDIVIGADETYGGGGSNAGYVKVFRNISGDWIQIGEDINGTGYDWLGHSVCLSSDGFNIAIGAPGTSNNFLLAGKVLVYKNIENSWIQIDGDIEGEEYDLLGSSVGISSNGSIIAAGAPGTDGDGNPGIVKVYQNNGGGWIQIGQDINGETDGDMFGKSLSLNSDGSIIAIGADRYDGISSFSGRVKIFQFIEDAWVKIGEDIDGEMQLDNLGRSVSLNSSGTRIAIGAPGSDGDNYKSGQVRVFQSPNANVFEYSNSFSIYPNPTTGIINFEFTNNNIQRLIISDIAGKMIVDKIEIQQNETIDISSFEKGIYIVSIQTDKEKFNTKILKR